MSIFRAFFFKCRLNRYQWYRRWHGGRWERHYIDICHCFIWLEMTPPKCWPAYRQPCSVGAPLVEDWPTTQHTGQSNAK